MENNSSNIHTEIVAQTDNFVAWKAHEPDDEVTYHIEVNNITIHFFKEEWDSFMTFKKEFINLPSGLTGTLAENEDYLVSCDVTETNENIYSLEITGATLYFFDDDWKEFCTLLKNI